MQNQDFLKELNVLYVEDDSEVRRTLKTTMEKLFKNLYVTCDGQEALNLFKDLQEQGIRVNAIVSDINMPNMNGLTLLEHVREENPLMPFIFTTAYSEVDFLLRAIKLNANDYILKPIDISELIDKIFVSCSFLRQRYIIQKQKKELERYLKAIDNVAIISKTDLRGNITFANKIFCEVSGYTKEEVMGQSHNMVRHPEMPSTAFKELWDTIQSGHTWQGKVKNRTKDGSTYYVNATIIPLYDDANENINEYMGIRFITTDDEIEKREFKKKVLKNIQHTKKKQIEDSNQIKQLEEKLESFAHVDLIEEALQGERKKTSKLVSQIKHYETEVKSMRVKNENLISSANEKVKKAAQMASELKGVNNNLSSELSSLEADIKEKDAIVKELNKHVIQQEKVILDLRDVIDHREEQLDRLKNK